MALGGNRIGKSCHAAYEMALAITGKHPYKKFPNEGLAWVVGLDNAMMRDIDRPMFEKYMPEHFKYKYYKQDNIWICKNEDRHWTVAFKSTEMGRDKFQGAQVDICWVDEEPKKTEIFSEIETRLVDKRGVWWLTGTPVRGSAWLKALSEREDVFTTFAGMRDNPYLPIEEIEKLAKTLPEEERLIRIEGRYLLFGGKPVFNIQLLNERLDELEVSGTTGIVTAA